MADWISSTWRGSLRTLSINGRTHSTRAVPPPASLLLTTDPDRPSRSGTIGSRLPKEIPPIEVLMDDLGAVLDEAGSRRAALTGFSDGADLCALFAATHPDRTAALVLYGSSAITRRTDDTPWAWTEEEWETYLEELWLGWGTEEIRSANA